ncbi:hypothetical protein DP149_06285 [Clostridium tetani]|uniref:hypothetical protein n=1 Tax=Clostridium tetani TaxID=1513 RepID=UPI00030B4DF0|nr:hypothetical protein [Clostridium tetani]KGI38375.1 hypothetical protein KY52_07735 [Clostridium tetani]KGI40248.1 hypothetical protein LA33_06150 [Clostridium tetani ATCC 9441]KGI42823.1 hypothetical protein KY54_12360 [Clostridium tetani]KHO33545.1 hypothetical protein OR63_05640 [Clostridium tetani]KIG21614.1 hypothetical protein RS78_03390 [Clostridium tetani]
MMALIIGLLLFLILVSININSKINKLENNLRYINFKLDKIIKQDEVYESKIDNNELRVLVEEGKRFDAANKVMDVMGFSVKESQKYVDVLMKKKLE